MKQPYASICWVALVILLIAPSWAAAGPKVLVIPKGSKAVFWKNVGLGAHQAGKDLGIGITYRGPYSEDRHDAQTQIVEFGIDRQYDAIVLAPNHVSRTAPALEKAVAAGVKVVLIDSNMETRHHACLVESDNYKAGRMAAAHAAALIGDAGKVVLARHIKGHASTHERESGFLETLRLNHPRIVVVADPYVGSSMGTAYHTISSLIDSHTIIDMFFSVSEEATLGILKALKERGLKGKVKFIGFDINTAIGKAVVDGDMDATIAQNPFQIGYQGVVAAHRLIRGLPVAPRIYTETILITSENYKTDKVQDIITSNIPQQDIY